LISNKLRKNTLHRQAQGVLRSAEKAIVTKTMQAGQVKSTQRARLAANGIAVGVGSAAEVQASTDIIKEIDKNQIKSNAVADAWGYRMKAVGYEGDALMAMAKKQSAGLNFGATLLSGASQIANNYMLMSAHGVFDEKDSIANKNLYCLISPVSFSCGNLVPSLLKESGKVTMLGGTSGGGACSVQLVSTADGSLFQISSPRHSAVVSNGAYYTIDRGVEPHHYFSKFESYFDREALTEYINGLK
jgi:hypothetical protein